MKICNDNHLYRSFGKQYSDGVHLGKDFGTFFGDEVFAPCELKIIDIIFANGYGSLNPSTKGYVIFADCKINGQDYNINFGHVNPKVKKDDIVKVGEVIGTIANFSNHGESLAHLHLGVHVGHGIPASPWGYIKNISDLNGWVNPVSLGLC
jgi:murein DD-endopeptidase MepM/ murein hydrolase activator NlpD